MDMKYDWLNEYWIYEEKKKVRRKSNGNSLPMMRAYVFSVCI